VPHVGGGFAHYLDFKYGSALKVPCKAVTPVNLAVCQLFTPLP
jgi:hypothetical protein